MSKSNLPIIGCILLLVVCICCWVFNFTPKPSEDEVLREMQILNSKVDSIKRANDSIKVIIDTTEVKIEHVYEKYIQVRERIAAQSVDSDCVFFSNYLSKDSERFIDTIDFKTIETY